MSSNLRGLLAAVTMMGLTSGCQQEMAQQPAYRTLDPGPFFADGRSARAPVAGTVARGQASAADSFATGRRGPGHVLMLAGLTVGAASGLVLLADPGYVRDFPLPMTPELLRRGQERYNIYCIVCHGATGAGDGVVVQRGFTRPPSYLRDGARGLPGYSLREAPVGYYFGVITHGYGAMADYAAQAPPRDRWAIVGYIRALQLSQGTPLEELPAEDRRYFAPGGPTP